MYTWDDSMEDWARPGAYRFDSARRDHRESAARASAASGGRVYVVDGPDESIVDPRKHILTRSSTPLVVAVDVTGSMARWPAEIFDRLPLLYNTLSQYRPDLEVCFAAIGDAYCDRWPLQATQFAQGFALETQLKALYGEGGGGDEPESYELFAWWMAHHVTLRPDSAGVASDPDEKPFLIVFGDAPMHPRVKPAQVRAVCGDRIQQEEDGVAVWRSLSERWNTWFLRRAGRAGDHVDEQWSRAVGAQHIVHIDDEQRAVDYALGLVARHWGHFDDFRTNMMARQSRAQVAAVESRLARATGTRTA